MKNTNLSLRKMTRALLCVLLLSLLLGQAALAANNVSDIAVNVVLNDDGSARITQTWTCDFSEGTEGYIPIQNLGDMTIADFVVSDENGVYSPVEEWDINSSFEEKAGKYGIVQTDSGYELCWGITEYGQRNYTIEYTVNKLVGAYTDYDGFNFQFINSGMGTLPTDVTVKITLHNAGALDDENCGIWAFGFDGKIEFQNGTVAAYTNRALSSSSDSVIIMLQLDKGILNPVRAVDESFVTVKDEAFKGSNYNHSSDTSSEDETASPMEIFLMLLTAGGIITAVVFLLVKAGKYSKALGTLKKQAEYFREVPLDGSIERTYTLASGFGQASDEGNIIGAAFLKLINSGCLEPLTESKVGFFGKVTESVSLRLVRAPEFTGFAEEKLYKLLTLSCGSDMVLQEKELDKYCRKHTDAISKIIDASKAYGKETLQQMGCYDTSKQAKPLGLSQLGIYHLSSIMGFKKYLLEFSLIGERTIRESVIWQDYLTFATLLGIADKAIEQFRKLYPEMTQLSQDSYYYYMLAHRYRHASYDAAQAARSAGAGGSSSMGGGGGFSGGGSGGGTR